MGKNMISRMIFKSTPVLRVNILLFHVGAELPFFRDTLAHRFKLNKMHSNHRTMRKISLWVGISTHQISVSFTKNILLTFVLFLLYSIICVFFKHFM